MSFYTILFQTPGAVPANLLGTVEPGRQSPHDESLFPMHNGNQTVPSNNDCRDSAFPGRHRTSIEETTTVWPGLLYTLSCSPLPYETLRFLLHTPHPHSPQEEDRAGTLDSAHLPHISYSDSIPFLLFTITFPVYFLMWVAGTGLLRLPSGLGLQ